LRLSVFALVLYEYKRKSVLKFDPPLFPATLIRRYKRFLADVELADGSIITVHTPNTGSMRGCATPGSRVWLRDTGNTKRKYRFSWEMSETTDGVMVGVNTLISNHIVRQAIESGVVSELSGYSQIRMEVPYGHERSRIDLLLENGAGAQCYVEVKNVTASDAQGFAIFPDAVTQRGTKHLRELQAMVRAGHRAVIFYCVQRQDMNKFRPADEIDPVYADTLRLVIGQGVEAMAYEAKVVPDEVCLMKALTISL